tara:strand:+ start:700 stop:1269 length:570 start_codon:yes stop_codon:yes gene_type:complete
MALAGAKIFAAMFVLSVAVNIPIAAKTLAILPQLKCVDNNDVTTIGSVIKFELVFKMCAADDVTTIEANANTAIAKGIANDAFSKLSRDFENLEKSLTLHIIVAQNEADAVAAWKNVFHEKLPALMLLPPSFVANAERTDCTTPPEETHVNINKRSVKNSKIGAASFSIVFMLSTSFQTTYACKSQNMI